MLLSHYNRRQTISNLRLIETNTNVAGRKGRGPARFRQRDVTRALRAMTAAKMEGRLEIEPDGTIVIVSGQPSEPDAFKIPTAANDNTWSDIDAA